MKKGFGIIEVIVGAAIMLSVVLASSNAIAQFLGRSHTTLDSLKSTYYLEEGIEAVKFLRDQGYTKNIASMSVGTNYYLTFSGAWATSTARSLEDGKFERFFSVEPVSRDGQGRVVESGGTLDPETKKIDMTVLWNSGNATTTRTMSVYLVNIFSN